MAEAALGPKDVVEAGLCIGCGACATQAGKLDWDGFGQLKPDGDWIARRTPEFERICPFSPAAANEDEIASERMPDARESDGLIGRFETAYVGAAAEDQFRAQGSSGGMVSWVAAELLRKGLIDGVAHVVPVDPHEEGRFFRFRISRSPEQVQQGARSRYYPVEMSRVLDEIRAVPGRYAIVGVPCFIKGVHLLRREDPLLADRIPYTLGLFCGHMKSARFVESFAWQLDVPFDEVRAVDYRRKDPGRPANWYTAHLTLADGSARWQDWWHLVDGDWGAGFFQNSACDYCDDVTAETADVAFGDAWVEPHSSDGRGTNVVISRSPEIARIIEEGRRETRLELEPVDAAFIIATQEAGLRHRREGLSYRLRIAPPALPLRKRVGPGGAELPLRRKLVYRLRRTIGRASHRVFARAGRHGWPRLYLLWAQLALRTYQAVTYHRGRFGAAIRWVEQRASRSA